MKFTRKNLINGQRPEIGNPAHIAWVKKKERLLSGQYPVAEADWEFVQYPGKTTETRKPITYHCDPDSADAVQCYIQCPRCDRLHKHVVGFDSTSMNQTAVWAIVDEQEIVCWNCGLEMYIEDDGSRNVYVRVPGLGI